MKKGFTLIELLVYMVIMGFIIVVAGRVFSDSTGMRVRTQNMTKASEEVNRVAEIIKEDLSQMGTKVWKDPAADPETNPADSIFKIVKNVYIGASAAPKDSSSFNLERDGDYDSITFRKISYNTDGVYIGTDLIKWYVRDSILYRCETAYENNDDCPQENEVAMAENVKKFTLNPSKPLDDDPNFPFGTGTSAKKFSLLKRDDGNHRPTTIDFPDDGNTATLSGDIPSGENIFEFFRSNTSMGQNKQYQVFVAESNQSGANFSACKKFNFIKNETYAVKFKTPFLGDDNLMTLFQPGVDHMAVGFRTTSGNTIPELPKDFMFYPPQYKARSINQYFEFSVIPPSADTVKNVCVAFTFAFYSGTEQAGPHKGNLQIENFELLRKNDGTYQFVRRDDIEVFLDSLESNEKKNKKKVKAFELILEVEKGNEAGSTRSGYVIPVPNNGLGAT